MLTAALYVYISLPRRFASRLAPHLAYMGLPRRLSSLAAASDRRGILKSTAISHKISSLSDSVLALFLRSAAVDGGIHSSSLSLFSLQQPAGGCRCLRQQQEKIANIQTLLSLLGGNHNGRFGKPVHVKPWGKLQPLWLLVMVAVRYRVAC